MEVHRQQPRCTAETAVTVLFTTDRLASREYAHGNTEASRSSWSSWVVVRYRWRLRCSTCWTRLKTLGSIRSFVETWLRVSLFSMCSASTCIIACCSDGVGGRSFSGPCATVSRELGSRTCHLVLWVRYAIIHSMQSTIHALQAPWTPTWGSSLLTRPLVWPKLQSQTAPCVTMLCISHLLI